jgi:purine-binding chemotaxis protein CheW
VGIAVDSVSEVLQLKAADIEATPHFGVDIDTGHIMAMATMDGKVKTLLDVDRIVDGEEMAPLAAAG